MDRKPGNELAMQLWHQRMAHLGPKNLARLESMAYGVNLTGEPESLLTCEACQRAKAKEHPHDHSMRPATRKFEFLHMDIMGPLNMNTQVHTPDYVLLITDDFTRYCHIELLNFRKEAIQTFIDWVEANDRNRALSRVRSDNEFHTTKFNDWCIQRNIHHEPTIPYTPEQNGLSERQNQTLMTRVRSVMTLTDVPIQAWTEIAYAVIWLKNRSPVTNRGQTPYELWYGEKPDLSRVKILGSRCFVKLPSEKLKKFHDRTVERILVGYEGRNFYRVWESFTIVPWKGS
jgi:hypothetical protein